MSKKDEALKLALEALEAEHSAVYGTSRTARAITAISEALAEQGCEFCSHPLYAGTKCKNCGREQPAIKQDLTPEQPEQQRLELIGHADLTIMNIYVFSEYGDTEIPEGRVPLYAGYKK
jgi:hypothetical protein